MALNFKALLNPVEIQDGVPVPEDGMITPCKGVIDLRSPTPEVSLASDCPPDGIIANGRGDQRKGPDALKPLNFDDQKTQAGMVVLCPLDSADEAYESSNAASIGVAKEPNKEATEEAAATIPSSEVSVAHCQVPLDDGHCFNSRQCEAGIVDSITVAIPPPSLLSADETPPQAMAALSDACRSVEFLPESRPTAVAVGYWGKMTEAGSIIKRHRAYGVPGKYFTLKVVQEGGSPGGKGGFQVAFGQVKLDPLLQGLTRVGVRAYCYIRQQQVTNGETCEQSNKNIIEAAFMARRKQREVTNNASILGLTSTLKTGSHATSGTDDLYQPRKIEAHKRNAPEDGHGSLLEMLREHAKSSTEEAYIAAITAADAKTDAGAASVHPRDDSLERQKTQHNNIGAELLFHDGVWFERKTTGPFLGKLASQGTIITVNEQDYVEYRVLAQPSFF